MLIRFLKRSKYMSRKRKTFKKDYLSPALRLRDILLVAAK
jgi:hypothetical protein